MKFLLFVFFVISLQVRDQGQVLGQGHGNFRNFEEVAQQYGFDNIKPGKFGLVVTGGQYTYHQALQTCRSVYNGVTLFTVDDQSDSAWLGRRINYEKDNLTGASKFWIGLNSRSSNGPLFWINGNGYRNYPEVVQVSGFDDQSKKVAWAVPDSGSRLKYEFLTLDDEAEAFICQYMGP